MKNIEILTLWKCLTEQEKKEVFRQLNEKLSLYLHRDERDGYVMGKMIDLTGQKQKGKHILSHLIAKT